MSDSISVQPEHLADHILVIRDQKVMLDADLAELYGVPTKRFNEQVKRNIARFPAEFMFQLTAEEFRNLRSQFATSSYATMLAATTLNSPQTVGRKSAAPSANARCIRRKAMRFSALHKLEQKVSSHDQALAGVIDAIRQLMAPPRTPKRPIGFTVDIEGKENA
ncbi:MAG: ORF6N domain-containing protein [Pseudomonadota bacterium]|nr:ORF6N domain-containing protein [Pseudomonadota bacterium]